MFTAIQWVSAVPIAGWVVSPYPWFTREEEAYLAICVTDFARLAVKSPTAATFFQFFQCHARPVPPRAAIATTRLSGEDFSVVPSVSDEDEAPTWSLAAYCPTVHKMLLPYRRLSPLIRGFVLSHETTHAFRNLSLGCGYSPELSGPWVREETAAILTGDAILNEVTGGAWSQLANEVWWNHLLAMAMGSRAPTTEALRELHPLEYETLARLFPEILEHEYGSLALHLLVGLHLRRYLALTRDPLAALGAVDWFVACLYRPIIFSPQAPGASSTRGFLFASG